MHSITAEGDYKAIPGAAKKGLAHFGEEGLKRDERYRSIRAMGKHERTDPSWLYRLLRKNG